MSGMSDDELFGSVPIQTAPSSPAAPVPATLSIPDGADPAVYTLLAEAGTDPKGQLAVASTIYNRGQSNKVSPADVVNDPSNGYEGWRDPHARNAVIQRYSPASPEYQAAEHALQSVTSGQVPAQPFTLFYSPNAQKALGRDKPAWDDGSGVNIGGNLFFGGSAPKGDLTPAEEAQFDALKAGPAIEAAPTDVRWFPGSAVSGAGAPTPAQAASANFLNQYGFWNADGEPGSSTHPLGVTANGTIPTQKGTWYLDQAGKLKQVGSPVDDYTVGYRTLANQRNVDVQHPVSSFFLHGVPQGLEDVGASINNLTGGALAAPAYGGGFGVTLPDVNPQFSQALMEGAKQQGVTDRNAFNLRFSGNPAAQGGRLFGQAAASVPLIAAGGEAVEGVPIVGNLLNAARSSPFFGAGVRVGAGAAQGASASALTSSTSDAPLPNQLAGGAVLGGATSLAAPFVKGAADSIFGNDLSPNVQALAQTAADKYGIPLRVGQIKAANGDRAAGYADSNQIMSSPGTAANNAAQRTAFTRAVTKTFGSDADALTPNVMRAAKTRIGGVMNDVGARNNIVDADGTMDRLKGIVYDASQVLPADDLTPIANQVQRIGETVDQTGQIPGEIYQSLTRKGTPLDRATESANPNIRYYAQQVRDALDDGMEASLTPEDRQAFGLARWQYKNLMTVKNIAAKANVEGEISPTLLNGAVNTSFKNRAFSGAGDLGELGQIGQAFMKEPPQSGTGPRWFDMLKKNPLLSAAGATGEGALFLTNPDLALKLAGVAGVGALTRMGLNASTAALNRSALMRNLYLSGGRAPGAAGNLLSAAGQIAGPSTVPISVLGANRLYQYNPQGTPNSLSAPVLAP